jgi:hypothetical protein
LFCPPDKVHLDLWYSDQLNESGVEKTVKFIQTAEKLFVWVSLEPCVMVLPPHCFHAVFTLTPACDIGVRAGSDFWKEEMKTVLQSMEKETHETTLRGSEEYPGIGMREIMRDFRVWVSWAENIKRKPSEKEEEVMRMMAPFMKTLKEILKA